MNRFVSLSTVAVACAVVHMSSVTSPLASTQTPTVHAEQTRGRLHADAALLVGLPQGDLENINASPSIRAAFGAWLTPMFEIHGAARLISLALDGAPSGVDGRYWDIGVGVRGAVPVAPAVKLYGDFEIINGTIGLMAGGDSESFSGLGVAARAGAAFTLSQRIDLTAGASYSTIGVEDDNTVAWLSLEAGAALWF